MRVLCLVPTQCPKQDLQRPQERASPFPGAELSLGGNSSSEDSFRRMPCSPYGGRQTGSVQSNLHRDLATSWAGVPTPSVFWAEGSGPLRGGATRQKESGSASHLEDKAFHLDGANTGLSHARETSSV